MRACWWTLRWKHGRSRMGDIKTVWNWKLCEWYFNEGFMRDGPLISHADFCIYAWQCFKQWYHGWRDWVLSSQRGYPSQCGLGASSLHATYHPSCHHHGSSYQSVAVYDTNTYVILQLLEAIRAISKTEAQKATSQSGNYQDSTMVPLGRSHNDNTAAQDDGDKRRLLVYPLMHQAISGHSVPKTQPAWGIFVSKLPI